MVWLRMNVLGVLLVFGTSAQGGEFLEDFSGDTLRQDDSALNGWAYLTGDGEARMTLSQTDGIGRIMVDARDDRRNTWWAFIRHSVSAHIDGVTLGRPDRELRVEARIRTDTVPRRVNLHFNHSRTTDYHSHLMEYDIPDAGKWHVISMTTKGFDALPADDVFVQMALMDWGCEQYEVEIDYVKVSVVDPDVTGPDLGAPLPYRPPIPPLASYAQMVVPEEIGVVDLGHARANRGGRPRPEVGGPQVMLMRWDFSGFDDETPRGWGVLELTTEALSPAGADSVELRVVEILGGDPAWTRETVTLESFLAGEAVHAVLNPQMIVDTRPAPERRGQTLIAISPPALQRFLTGRSLGIAIHDQGAIDVSLRASGPRYAVAAAKLYLNFENPRTGELENNNAN